MPYPFPSHSNRKKPMNPDPIINPKLFSDPNQDIRKISPKTLILDLISPLPSYPSVPYLLETHQVIGLSAQSVNSIPPQGGRGTHQVREEDNRSPTRPAGGK
ncbi:hypothetical protein AAMO2058_001356900 [Amorphochlora amoebiformis]